MLSSALSLAAERERTQRRLIDFTRAAWGVVEPGKAFISGWHIEAIADHLQAVSEGQIRRLIVNVPPRHMKSLQDAVFWPSWDWIKNPSRQWLFSSYAHSLSIRDSVRCRRLLEHPWYQARWGTKFRLTSDQNTKLRFDNDKNGYRLATSVDGSLTGEGGDIIVVDDPHNVRQVESATTRQAVLDWWDQSMSTRLNGADGAYVIVMQRVHERDLVGHILATELGYDHLCLPAEYEANHPTPVKSSLGFTDPRKEEGDLLWPARFTRATINEIKGKLGSLGAAGQLQQRPSPKGGAILRRDWWRSWLQVKLPECSLIIQSWDTAFGEKEQGDYSRCTTWGVFKPVKDGPECAIMLDARGGKPEFPDLRRQAQDLYDEWSPDIVLIENKASGLSLAQELRKAGVPVRIFDPKGRIRGARVGGDKVARANMASVILEGGRIYAPCKLATDGKSRIATKFTDWAEEVVAECQAFPAGEHDDYVDSCTQTWLTLRYGLGVEAPDDEEKAKPTKQPKRKAMYG